MQNINFLSGDANISLRSGEKYHLVIHVFVIHTLHGGVQFALGDHKPFYFQKKELLHNCKP